MERDPAFDKYIHVTSFHYSVCQQTGNVDISNNLLTERIPESVCMLSVYEEGEIVEFRADCDICLCKDLCDPWCKGGTNQ
jgi:hypothetical protein